MTHNTENNMITPQEDYMLFNGQVYSNCVYLGSLDSVDNWQEVPMAQYEEYLAQLEEERMRKETESFPEGEE